MKKRLVMVTVHSNRGKIFRLAYGKVLPDGKVIVKESIIEECLDKVADERGENVWGWF